MFTLDLTRLRRSGSRDPEVGRLEGEIPADDAVWAGMDARPDGPVAVSLRAALTPTGQLVVRGRMEGATLHECRRCLEEVRHPLREDVDLVWVVPDELEGPVEGEEIRVLDPGGSEVDVGEALREELLLRIPRWMLCREDCAGLCPRCGINRNEETCDCSLEEPDPRWAALRELKLDERK
jgi:uncharacterized protein